MRRSLVMPDTLLNGNVFLCYSDQAEARRQKNKAAKQRRAERIEQKRKELFEQISKEEEPAK